MKFFIASFLALATLDHVIGAPTDASSGLKFCRLPGVLAPFETADASEVNVDQDIANKAIAAVANNGNVSVKIFRNNCLFASSQAMYPRAKTDGIPQNIFSATKGVISILAGIAHDRRLLNLDDPIGKYLPQGISGTWGDFAHRAITIRQLLTESAGTKTDIIAESITVLQDPSIPQQALAVPLQHVPGTVFTYSQRVPDLLAYVVSRAVRQELQAFAQENLFAPLGIASNRYVWFRDRSGNSYGYAWLYLAAEDFARIGLLMQNRGVYNGIRVLSESWTRQVAIPSPTNGCYGFLFWSNGISPTSPHNDTCYGPSGHFFHRSWLPSAPRDLFAMAGAPDQKNFMIPSLNMTVSFMTVLDSPSPGNTTFYNFFKTLMPGIRDPHFVIPGPGTYEPDSIDGLSLSNANSSFNLDDFLKKVNPNFGCTDNCNDNGSKGGGLGGLVQGIGSLLNKVGSPLGLNKLLHGLLGA